MKNAPLYSLTAGLALAMLGFFVLGCEDQSENVPVQWDEISELMAMGWAEYEAGDYLDAKASFEAAGSRNAQFLPAYNGLGWCAVRLTNFDDAEEQFSFITTLADPAIEAEKRLLADAFAGLCLAAAIERSVLEISGEATPEELQEHALNSIEFSGAVFDLMGEDYAPEDHDPGFGSTSLHLLNAQNYFYLQEFEASEVQLSAVDSNFVDSLLVDAGYGTTVENESIPLEMIEVDQDTSWFLNPAIPGIHHYTQIASPDTSFVLEYDVLYDENSIQVLPAPGTPLEAEMIFTVSYVYIEDFAEYLYLLIQRIEELIQF